MEDIRFRDWAKLDTKVSKALTLFIELENILDDLDDLSLANNQCYSYFNAFCIQLGAIRKDFTEYVENNNSVLEITDYNYKNYFKK